jgi:hypothetical protein
MIKIKINAPWTTSELATKRLLDQFKTSDTDLDSIEFVYDNSYDYIIFLNYVNEIIQPNARAFVFPHEPTWSGNHQLNFKDTPDVTILGFDCNYYNAENICIETTAHTYYGGRGSWIDNESDWNYKKSLEYNSTVKTKNISSIVSTLDANTNQSVECTYANRHALVEYLVPRSPFVDFYCGWTGHNHTKPDPQKLKAVEDYKFCLAIENQYIKNWITEKFYDSIITNTIPIYYGCLNIKQIYPEDGYILLDNVTDVNYVHDMLRYINANAAEIYHQKLPGLLEIKRRYFEEYNLLKKIKILCESTFVREIKNG